MLEMNSIRVDVKVGISLKLTFLVILNLNVDNTV